MPDAKIRVSGRNLNNPAQGVGPNAATPAFATPNWYGVNLPIKEAGPWVFALEVDSSLGRVQEHFSVQVQQTNGIGWLQIGAVAVLLAVLAAVALTWRRGKAKDGSRRH